MSEHILTTIESVFQPDEFIVKGDLYGNYDISTKDNKLCVSFTFNENEIYIWSLNKCDRNGTRILQLIEEFAKKMPEIECITLEDNSRITTRCRDVSIKLAPLKILTKGHSWYNSHGYVSPNYEQEKSHNAEIAQIPFHEVVHLGVEKQIDKYKIRNPEQIASVRLKAMKMLEDAQRLFPEIDTSTGIHDYLLESVNDSFDELNMDEKHKFLQDLLDMVFDLLKYDVHLQKRITRKGK
jgi:hypothetical protein